MNPADKNLALRTEILGIALDIEDNVNMLLLNYLNIENEHRKAITNKSGNIPFKNKIDLLYDLDIFDKEEHKIFLLLMEFRNQFLHNIECISFKHAVSVLGDDKKKSLLKYANPQENQDEESRYKAAFSNLYGSSLKVALSKIERRKQILKDKHDLLINHQENAIYLIDAICDMAINVINEYLPEDSDSTEIIDLKGKICNSLKSEIDRIFSSEKYKELRSEHEKFHYEGRIKKFLK